MDDKIKLLNVRGQEQQEKIELDEINNVDSPQSQAEEAFSNLPSENFPTVDSAIEYFTNTENRQSATDETVQVLIATIDSTLQPFDENEMQRLSECLNFPCVIAFQSGEDGKFCVIWRSQESSDVFTLNLFDEMELGDLRLLCGFIVEFLSCCLNDGHCGLSSVPSSSVNAYNLRLTTLEDKQGHNLFFHAVCSGHTRIVKILLEFAFSVNLTYDNLVAADFAYANGHSETLLELLNANSRFPVDFDPLRCSQEVQDFAAICSKYHEDIASGDIAEVRRAMTENPNLRYFYNTENVSASAAAISHRQLDIYELLISQHFYFSLWEDAGVIMSSLSTEECAGIREIHFRHKKAVQEEHLNVLMSKSFVGHDVFGLQEKLNLISRAFEVLNTFACIRIIMQIAARMKDLHVVFDFNRDSVQYLDPTVNSYTLGLFYGNGRIYIGARQLLDPCTEHQTFATLAHELCHYVMYVVFENFAKPYRDRDSRALASFNAVSLACERQRQLEEIIGLVYEIYPSEHHHAELIVRVPHMLAHYYDQPETVDRLRIDFKPLFDFFEVKLVPKLEKALEKLENESATEAKAKDRKISILTVISIILLVFLPVTAVVVGAWLYEPTYSWEELSESDRAMVLNGAVKYEGVEAKFREIFSINDSGVLEALSSQQIRELKHGEVVNLSAPQNEALERKIRVGYGNLTDGLREKVIRGLADFQGEVVKFYELVMEEPIYYKNLSFVDIYASMSSDEIVRLIKSETLNISYQIIENFEQSVDADFAMKLKSYELRIQKYQFLRDSDREIAFRIRHEIRLRREGLSSHKVNESQSVYIQNEAENTQKQFETIQDQFEDFFNSNINNGNVIKSGDIQNQTENIDGNIESHERNSYSQRHTENIDKNLESHEKIKGSEKHMENPPENTTKPEKSRENIEKVTDSHRRNRNSHNQMENIDVTKESHEKINSSHKPFENAPESATNPEETDKNIENVTESHVRNNISHNQTENIDKILESHEKINNSQNHVENPPNNTTTPKSPEEIHQKPHRIQIPPKNLPQLLKIGTKIPNTPDFYVNRKFIDKDIYADRHIFDREKIQFMLLFSEADKRVLSKSIDELIAESQTTRFVLLSDDAGTGKTTTFTHLALHLKRQFPTQWIQYVDLKAHTTTFNVVGGEKEVEPILAGILKLSTLDFNVFLKLVEKNAVVFLWDGFDEISPTYSDLVLAMIYSISISTRNIHWIATRPTSETTLTDVFDCTVYRLFPYREAENREFLHKFFDSRNFNHTERERVERNVAKIITKVENATLTFVESPLLLRMIAEVALEDERSVDVDSIYAIYDSFARKKLAITSKKGDIVLSVQDDILIDRKLNLFEVFQYFAIKFLFPDGFGDLFSSNFDVKIPLNALWIVRKYDKMAFNTNALSHYGILVFDSLGQPSFAHRTFAEFLVAQYFVDSVYQLSDEPANDEVEARLKFVIDALIFEWKEKIYEFVTDFLMNFKFKHIRDDTDARNNVGKQESYNSSQKLPHDFPYSKEITTMFTAKFSKLFYFAMRFEQDSFDTVIGLMSVFQFRGQLLSHLWAVNENQTLFTWIATRKTSEFLGKFEKIRATVGKFYRNEMSVIVGRNQRGNFLYGAFKEAKRNGTFKSDELLRALGVSMSFKADDFEDFPSFFSFLKTHLTTEEQREIFKANFVEILCETVKANQTTSQMLNTTDFSQIWMEINTLFTATEVNELLCQQSISGKSLLAFTDHIELINFTLSECRDSDHFFDLLRFPLHYKTWNLALRNDRIEHFSYFYDALAGRTTRMQTREFLETPLRDDYRFRPGVNAFVASIYYGNRELFTRVRKVYENLYPRARMRTFCLDFFDKISTGNHFERLILNDTAEAFIELLRESFSSVDDMRQSLVQPLTNFYLDYGLGQKRSGNVTHPMFLLLKSLVSAEQFDEINQSTAFTFGSIAKRLREKREIDYF